MRGSTNRGRYQCSRAGAGVCPVSFGLSSALPTSGSPPAATPDEVITLYREAVALLPAEHPLRAGLYNNLATALWTRYKMAGSSHLFDKMITVDRETLALRPAGHPDRFMSCNELAVTLLTCYEMTGTTDLLDEAIALHREALALQPAGHPHRAMLCNNLASALHTRYEMTGAADLLAEAVTLHREALALCPAGHTFRASACNNLAITLRGRYEVTGDSGLLDESITLHREALALRPAGHPDRSMLCNNLANALQTRYEMTGSSDLLDEAITLLREALALCPVGPPLRAGLGSNLANALWARYKMTGSSDLLDEAITLYRESLALRPAAHPDRASSCNNLANALRARYNETDSSDLLDESITLQREALDLRPAGHPDRSMSCNNLANALWTRYEITGSSDLLDETIALHREALALRPDGHPDRSASCNHVASQLLQRFRQTHDVADIHEALLLARESAASSSPSSLCEALLILCDVHMEQDSPHLSISTATEYLAQASALFYDSPTTLTEAISSRLTLIWSLRSTWTNDIHQLLLSAYTNLIDRLSRMTGFTIDTVSQLTALRSARSFGSDACIVALLSSQPRQAIELIDHAHGVIWAQALHQRDPQLLDIPGGIASELESLLRAVSVPVATGAIMSPEPATLYLSREDIRHQQNSRVQTILMEIRAMPGLERFMLGKTYVQLRETAIEHPVVVLVSSHGHIYALTMRNAVQEHPDVLPLKITSDRLARLRDTATRVGLRTRTAMRDVESESDRQMRPGRFEDTALGTLASLWHDIVKPVVEHLQLPRATGRAKPRLHWCATGDFAFLPIHAAGIYIGPEDSHVCCSDYVVSSYTPTLSALLNAQNKAPQTAPSHLNILAVAEDGRGPGSTVSPLFGVEPELICVQNAAQASGHECSVNLITKHATGDSIAERIQTAHFVHLACHGTQDLDDALESGFHLSDGLLKMSKLMYLNLDKAWFAYLSACETAKSDTNQPDQVVHVTAAMLHAGFKSVVATMWSMADDDDPVMAQWFYGDLLSNEIIDADAVAYALDAAVEKLRAKMPRAPTRWAPYIHMGA